MSSREMSKTKLTVIIGLILVVAVFIVGLIALYEDRENGISLSHKIMLIVSLISIIIALIFAILLFSVIAKSERCKKELEESNKFTSDLLNSRHKFTLTISHDIKAPVSSILGFIELLSEGIFSDLSKETIIDYLNNMKSSASHVLQLVTTLLNYTKLQEGKWNFDNKDFELHELVEFTTKSFQPIAKGKYLDYHVDNQIQKNKIYNGDPYVLRMIIGNLISNAVKYTNRGEVKIVVKEKEKDLIYISVSDTGIGIDVKDQVLIFKKYNKVEEQTAYEKNIERSGLGLAITRRLVIELKGKLDLISVKGVGSEFIIELPLKSVSEVTNCAEITNHNDLHIQTKKDISVLVIEDDPIQLKMISEMIKNKGMNCVGASTSEMVLSELRKNRFDIIFADIHLETISGIDLIKDIKKIDSNILNEIPIIILSATSDLTKSSLISYGFTDFLAKPFNSVDLYKMINLYTNAGLITGKEEKQHSKGIHSLIEYVKDDEKLSVEILESFINETVGSRNLLENSFQQNNYLSARQVSHKIYPLIKMIGDNQVISMVKIMESGNKLTKDMEMFILAELNRYIEEAEQLKDVIITKLNEQK